MKLVGMLAMLASCNVHFGSSSTSSCGAEVRFTGADGHWVNVEIANTTDDTIEIGSGIDASFVDADGTAMAPQMTPGEDSWFMPFQLPAHSHRAVRIRVKGGDPSRLARIEIPRSGETPFPECTIKATL